MRKKASFFEKVDLFNLSDSASLIGKEFISIGTEIKRQFPINDCILNLNAKYNQEFVFFEFNYHHSVTKASEITEIINEDIIIDYKDKALEIMRDVYNLQLDKEDEEE